MGPKYEHFKFAIGDIVQHKIAHSQPGRKMMIVERIYQECPGGVQLLYCCAMLGHSMGRSNEIELEIYAKHPTELADEEWITERLTKTVKRTPTADKQ